MTIHKYIILIISIVSFFACSSADINSQELTTNTFETNSMDTIKGFRWDLPVKGYQQINKHGPVKEIRIKNVAYINESLPYKERYSLPKSGVDSGILIYNFYLRFNENGYITLRKEIANENIFEMSQDSINMLLLEKIKPGRKIIYDQSQYTDLSKEFSGLLQDFPWFMSGDGLAPPLYMKINQLGDYTEQKPENKFRDMGGWKMKSYLEPQVRTFRYYYENEKLKGYEISKGFLNYYIFSDTVFKDLIYEVYDARKDAPNPLKMYISPRYVTLDSTMWVMERNNKHIVYDYFGMPVKKLTEWKIGSPLRYFRAQYTRERDGLSSSLPDSSYLDEDIYIYDNLFRLDSHYLARRSDVDAEKYYYSGSKRIPDSLFRNTASTGFGWGEGSTNYFTSVFDEEGKIIEQRYYDKYKRRILYHYILEYSDYDEYHNWRKCQKYVLIKNHNNTAKDSLVLLHEQYKQYEYYIDSTVITK